MARPRKPKGPAARLRRNLSRVLRQGHPWVWREALDGLDAVPGAVVEVLDKKGAFVARGIADGGPIGVRVWTTDRRVAVDEALIRRRVAEASALRDWVIPEGTDAYRLLHGEGDRTPGVQCDVYGAVAVLRFDGDGVAQWQQAILAALSPVLAERGVTTLLLRSGRRREGSLEVVFGELPPGRLVVTEHGMKMLVDVVEGQKTGLFLDHRDSRFRVRGLAPGREVLNLYGYTGAFSVSAGLGGASRVETVDLAAPALAFADDAWALNGLPEGAHRSEKADVPTFLAQAKRDGRRWDLIISDPPSFAPRESAREAALAAYHKLHRACFEVLREGGLFLAASCSSHVRRDDFEATVLEAAGKLRRPLQHLGSWGAGADHPRLPVFVEGDYLKAMLVRA